MPQPTVLPSEDECCRLGRQVWPEPAVLRLDARASNVMQMGRPANHLESSATTACRRADFVARPARPDVACRMLRVASASIDVGMAVLREEEVVRTGLRVHRQASVARLSNRPQRLAR